MASVAAKLELSMNRTGLSLSLGVVACFSFIALACGTSQPEPTLAQDIRATVVAEITATALAAHTTAPLPADTAVTQPVSSGSLIPAAPEISSGIRASDPTQPEPTPTPSPISTPAPIETPTLSSIVEEISPSVVQVVTPSGTGSGFVIDEYGRVLTSAHVVGRLETVMVKSSGGRTYTGEVLGVDEVADLALIYLGYSAALDPVTLSSSDEIEVGEEVIVIGFPLVDTLGVSPTITRGIVSAKRSSESEIALLQTDAAINPGSSGGPLLDRSGQVIGVNTSKLFESDDGRPLEGIGMAVSVDEVRTRLQSLKRRKSVLLDTPSEFGTRELASALEDLLPRSFEQLDPKAEGLTIDDFGIEDFDRNLVAYASADPFHLIMASTKELSDLDRIALEHELLDLHAFKGAFEEPIKDDPDASINDFGLLSMGRIGDSAIGAFVDLFDEGEVRAELAMFIRDNYVVLLAILYFPATEPSVSVEDVARAIDVAMIDHLD